MIDQLDSLPIILDQEVKLRRLECKFMKNRYSNFSETLNKLKGESRDQLLDYAREFQREMLTYILTVEAKLRMWKKFADEYSQQIPDDPKIRELLALYVGYFRIYHDVQKIYDQNVNLLQEVLGEDDFNGISIRNAIYTPLIS